QRQEVARHHELQGKLRRLPKGAGVVEPAGEGQRRKCRNGGPRQRSRHPRASSSGSSVPLIVPAKQEGDQPLDASSQSTFIGLRFANVTRSCVVHPSFNDGWSKTCF